jgi:hypothetical protein
MMARSRSDIWADIKKLLSLDEWTEMDEADYEILFDEYPDETIEDALTKQTFDEAADLIDRV